MTTAQTQTVMGLLAAALLPGEKARFEVAVASDGDVIATVLPVRQPTGGDERTPEAAEDLIAALTMPIQMRAPAERIEAEVVSTLGQYRKQRHAINETLEALNEALVRGKTEAHEAATKQTAPEGSQASSQAAAKQDVASASQSATEYGTDNPDAL